MPVFSHLQELSATVFGVNVAYLALNQFRYQHAVQEHAVHVVKNARLANEIDLPQHIVEFELFKNLVYLSGPHANLYHVNAVVQVNENGNAENPNLLKETDYRKIPAPNRDAHAQKISKKFEQKIDQSWVQRAAAISFFVLLLATMDSLYDFDKSHIIAYGGYISAWVATFIIIACFFVPLHWISVGRKFRDTTIGWIDQGAPELFQKSWSWNESKQIPNLPDPSDQRPHLEQPKK